MSYYDVESKVCLLTYKTHTRENNIEVCESLGSLGSSYKQYLPSGCHNVVQPPLLLTALAPSGADTRNFSYVIFGGGGGGCELS